MNEWQIGAIESRFADIIWKNEPIASGLLAKKGEEVLGWKKSTTYTVLKKLCNKGIFKNENAVVSAVVSKEEYNFLESERLIDQSFDGSLPEFFAAFTSRRKLTEKEIGELYRVLAEYKD